MRRQSNELKNRINQAGLHCVWTRSNRKPGAPLIAHWVYDQQARTATAMTAQTVYTMRISKNEPTPHIQRVSSRLDFPAVVRKFGKLGWRHVR